MESSSSLPKLSEQDRARAALQEELKTMLVCADTEPWATAQHNDDPSDLPDCQYIAGLDVSYEKDSTETCAALVIFDCHTWTTVYEGLKFGQVSTDYAAGFLAFREIDILMDLVREFRAQPDCEKIEPHVWLIDGNGIMHPRGLGLASHFGVLIDRPTVGVSKNPYFFNDGGAAAVDKKAYKERLEAALVTRGDRYEIEGPAANSVVGVALKTRDGVKNPVYVSIGHRVSLKTAIRVTLKCCRQFKNPEPLRLADIVSREALRKRVHP